MATNITLQDALNDCIDRLANGATLDECLRTYPQYAAELRPLLAAGQLPTQARAGAGEVEAAQLRVRAQLQVELDDFDVSGGRGLPRGTLLLVALLVGLLGTSALIALVRRQENVPITATMTPTSAPTQTAAFTATPPTLTATATWTVEPSSTATQTPEASPTTTQTLVPVPTVTEAVTLPPTATTPADFAVNADEAAATAQAIFPNLAVVGVELETYPDGNLVWDVEFETERHVDIDASSGNVLAFGFESEDTNEYTAPSSPSQPNNPAAPVAGAGGGVGGNDDDDDGGNGGSGDNGGSGSGNGGNNDGGGDNGDDNDDSDDDRGDDDDGDD